MNVPRDPSLKSIVSTKVLPSTLQDIRFGIVYKGLDWPTCNFLVALIHTSYCHYRYLHGSTCSLSPYNEAETLNSTVNIPRAFSWMRHPCLCLTYTNPFFCQIELGNHKWTVSDVFLCINLWQPNSFYGSLNPIIVI